MCYALFLYIIFIIMYYACPGKIAIFVLMKDKLCRSLTIDNLRKKRNLVLKKDNFRYCILFFVVCAWKEHNATG